MNLHENLLYILCVEYLKCTNISQITESSHPIKLIKQVIHFLLLNFSPLCHTFFNSFFISSVLKIKFSLLAINVKKTSLKLSVSVFHHRFCVVYSAVLRGIFVFSGVHFHCVFCCCVFSLLHVVCSNRIHNE